MNKKQLKKLKPRVRTIQAEWLRTLVSEEEANSITIENVSDLLSKQTHTFIGGKFELSFMSDKSILKKLKKDPSINTYVELMASINKKETKENAWKIT